MIKTVASPIFKRFKFLDPANDFKPFEGSNLILNWILYHRGEAIG